MTRICAFLILRTPSSLFLSFQLFQVTTASCSCVFPATTAAFSFLPKPAQKGSSRIQYVPASCVHNKYNMWSWERFKRVSSGLLFFSPSTQIKWRLTYKLYNQRFGTKEVDVLQVKRWSSKKKWKHLLGMYHKWADPFHCLMPNYVKWPIYAVLPLWIIWGHERKTCLAKAL